MSEEEFAELKVDIAGNGLRYPIVMLGDAVLDGRHRLRACKELGVVPRFEQFAGGDPVAFVLSANLKRRHLNGSQRAVVALRVEEYHAREAKQRQRQAAERTNAALGRSAPTHVEPVPQPSSLEEKRSVRDEQAKKAREQAGKTVGVSGRYVQDAKKVKEEAPDLLPKVEAGEITLPEAKKEIRQREKAKKVAAIAKQEPAPLDATGTFSVVYADPPWRYEHAEPTRAIENNYPTMSLDEIKALDVPAADDAVLFLWATSPLLDQSLEVMRAWGFEYRTCMVWVKDRIGMGYYARQRHELLLIGRKGSLRVPDPEDRPDSVVMAARGQHSAKPDAFYTLIERMYPGERYVELFARRPRDRWAAWGNQAGAA